MAPYPSWEDTKTWWIGGRQALGKKTESSFAWRRHSDLFVLFRDQPEIYTNHHADESYQAALRRRETLGVGHYHLVRRGRPARIHREQQSGRFMLQPRRCLRGGGLPRAAQVLADRGGAGGDLAQPFRDTKPYHRRRSPGLNPRFKFRGSASRAFRVPSYTELYYSDPSDFGNPNLRPESAWTYEGGADWQPISRGCAAS